MKKTIVLLLLMLWPCFSRAQSNVLYATLADFGISVDTNVQMTLTLVSPKNRTINNVLISNGPKTATTDTNGYFSFTNIAWGNYFLQASDTGSTRWPLQVWTNTVGNVQLASLITNSMTLPPNPDSNYLTQAQIQALFSGVTRGLGSPDGSVTITATNLGDGTFSYGLQVVGGGSATNVLFGASTNIMTYLFGGTNYFYVPGGTFYPYSGNPAGFLTSSSLTPYALISSLGNAADGDTNLMSVLHATNADNAVTAVNLSGNISGAQVTSGTVSDARLSGNVVLLNGTQTFSGANTFSNPPAINTTFGANIMSPTNENFWQGRQYADQAVWGTPVGYEPWTILGASGGQEANMIAAAQNISNYNLTAYAPGGFYVDITDGWATNAPLNPNPNWFPDGLPYTIATMHAYGLKVGPYLEPNATMSAGDPGMTNYDQTASWLVRSNAFDFVRFDQPGVNSLQNCVTNMQRLYNAIHQYTSKPFPIFSFVSPSAPEGLGTNADLNSLAGLPPNSTIFIAGDWDARGFSIFQLWTNYMYELTNVAYQASQFVKPGRSIGLFYAQNNYQNDPDIVSRGIVDGFALMHFPMILTAVGGFTGPLQQQITTNGEMWQVAQDPSYFQPQMLQMATDHIVISRQMANGDRVVGMFNTLTNQSVNIGFALQQIGFNNDGNQYAIRELSWQTNCGIFTSTYTSAVPAMEMRFLRVTPVNNTMVNGTNIFGTITGNGAGVTNLNLYTFNTNAWVGSVFPLGTNTTVATNNTVGFTGLSGASTTQEREGKFIILASANLSVTNPGSWHASDYGTTRTLTNGNTMTILLDVVPGLATNFIFVQAK
ncbi:MAG: hypothetical protein KGL39_30245 [Patescibacteria group bacterium]|nr:hypothetical protein [Patescibacteria group bacterium]